MIIHLDADAFFASVEQAADPWLRGKPIAVGGERRGVVTSASYEARAMGVYTPMPTLRARKVCPKLIVVPGNFELYEQFSRFMFSYAYDFTPLVEKTSVDEGYFDLTPNRQKRAMDVAKTIRKAIHDSLKLPISEGIASSKLVSQVASKLRKPKGLVEVPRGQERSFLQPLPVKWLPGVGPKLNVELNAAGFREIGQLALTPPDELALFAGSFAPRLAQFARGEDERPVDPGHEEAKSYGHQETFDEDTTNQAFILAKLRQTADGLMVKVRNDAKSIRTVSLKIRYNDMDEVQRSYSFREPTDLESDIYPLLPTLLKQAWERRVSLRLVALRFSNIYQALPQEFDFGMPELNRGARQRLSNAVDDLQRKGLPIMHGHDFWLKRYEENRREKEKRKTKRRIRKSVIARKNREACSQASLPVSNNMDESMAAEAPAPYRNASKKRKAVHSDRMGEAKTTTSNQRTRRSRNGFFPLNIKSCFSFNDSLLTPERIVELASYYDYEYIAITDPNLHGAVALAQAASKAGVKSIVGAELMIQKGASEPPLQINAYVENAQGYEHLCRMLSEEKIDYAFYQDHREGLYTVSMNEEATMSLPETRYERHADRHKYEILQSMRTLSLAGQAHPDKRRGDFHFPSPSEMKERLEKEDLRVLHEIADRCEFVYQFGGKLQYPPYRPRDNSSPREFLAKLTWEGFEKFYDKRRPFQGKYSNIKDKVQDELDIIGEVGYEEYFLIVWDLLQDCREKGWEWVMRGSAGDSYVCYCLGFSDFEPVRFELYSQRFLNRERMKLNKLPDIDLDFAYDQRDEVMQHMLAKYDSEHAALVGGFSMYRYRSAVAEIAKTLGVSEWQIRRFTERMPSGGNFSTIKKSIVGRVECRDLPVSEEPYKTAIELAGMLDGLPRHPKAHPCGVVLSGVPIKGLVPVFQTAKGYPATQMDMDGVEDLGLVKFDILGQAGLAVMRDATVVAQRLTALPSSSGPADRHFHPSDGHLWLCDPSGRYSSNNGLKGQMTMNDGPQDHNVAPEAQTNATSPMLLTGSDMEPWEDQKVWEMIRSGRARGVHHIESPAMTSLCSMCGVKDINVLIAIVSVVRPGAANQLRKLEFSRRCQGLSETDYVHESLEGIMKTTFGVMAYEEHVLEICEAFAAIPPGESDRLRRALAKENQEDVDKFFPDFECYAKQLARKDEEIVKVWELLTGFFGYAFCRSHSTAYAMQAYKAAWFKMHHPAAFMSQVLTHGKGFYSRFFYTLECRRLGLDLCSPCVNASRREQFILASGKSIRVPLGQIMGLTTKTLDRWEGERVKSAFTSLSDFHFRVMAEAEEVLLLIRAGAFDRLDQSRTRLFWEARRLFRWSDHRGGNWLFHSSNEMARGLPDHLEEPDLQERLSNEMELFGYTITKHPLDLHPDIDWDVYTPISDLLRHVGKKVRVCGFVVQTRLHNQINGEPMKFLSIADYWGITETEMFSEAYKKYGDATVRYPVLEAVGTVESFENGLGCTLHIEKICQPRKKDVYELARLN